MASYLKDIFGTGTNIFGQSAGGETDLLVKNGLLSREDVEKAENASLMKGLIGTGISYLAQPKNQDYGSFVPYLAKGFQQGMEQAKQPFADLRSTANSTMKMEDYALQKQSRERDAVTRELMDKVRNPDGTINSEVLTQLRAIDPKAYLQYQELELNDAKIDKLYSEAEENRATGGGLDMEAIAKHSHKYVPSSFTKFTQTGNPNDLIPLSMVKDKADIQKVRMEILETQGQDALDRFDAGTVQQTSTGAPKTPEMVMDDSQGTSHDFVNSQGVKVTPLIHDTTQPMSEIKKYRREQGKVTNAFQSQSEVLRRERNLIRKLLNSEGLDRMVGTASYLNWATFRGGDASDAEAMLYGIRQLEFISNYQRIKQAGGGFGSLTEKEGDRLEQMASVLDEKQSVEQFRYNLMVLDRELAKFEQLDRDTYEDIYGKSNYEVVKLNQLPSDVENIFEQQYDNMTGPQTSQSGISDDEVDKIIGIK
jgi:hypothetical protein